MRTFTLFAVLATVVSATTSDLSDAFQKILSRSGSDARYTYPTDLTRGIIPISVHSHNDYWRALPLYTALSVGCISIEADVWLYNSTLYVGHETSALTVARTFESLYINPLLDILTKQNPVSPFVTAPTQHGVFDGYSTQTLYLFVDVKTPGDETWPFVVKALEPLRKAGYLSRVESTSSATITYGPVTVIGTGNTPLSQVQPVVPRDYFYDAPIPTLNSTFSNITSLVSPIASTDFAVQFGTIHNTSVAFNESQLALLRAQVAVAHKKGIKLRYWDQPAWPISLRNGVWKLLWDEGVDLINADDVAAAAGLW
ncbi:hypothetical protein MMC07_001057 [Pseudocyphellaria aurata]|nr:hypothetical protein [Pseudocyphellaria aurata]